MNTGQGGLRPCCADVVVRVRHGRGWLRGIAAVLIAVGLWAGSGDGARAADPKLMAPVYPGAVPMVTASGKPAPCVRDKDFKVEVWCYLTNDSLEKVKAFYDKQAGALEMRKSGRGAFLWLQHVDTGEADEDHFGGVEVRIGKRPPELPSGDAAGQSELLQHSRHFKELNAAAMNARSGLEKPHTPAEVAQLYAKYAYLETAYFRSMHNGKELVPADEMLHQEYKSKSEQAAKDASTGMQSDVQGQMSRNMAQAGRPNPAAQQEDAELKALLDKNPKVANAYSKKAMHVNELIQQGKYEEAGKEGHDAEKLLRSDPAIAAHLDKMEQRRKQEGQQRRQSDQATQQQMMSGYAKHMDYAAWGAWSDYLAAAGKQGYRTLIRIDVPGSGKGVTLGREQVAAKWKNQLERWRGQGRDEEGRELARADGSTPGASAGRSAAAQAPAKAAPPATAQQAPQQKPEPQPEKKNDATEVAKKGFNALKKLF
jgi:hypothetical protein